MDTSLLPGLRPDTKPIFGMLHLPPLPGAPRYGGTMDAVLDATLRDADTLVAGGVDGLLMENFNDTPFYPDRVPPFVVAHMTVLAREVVSRFDVPLGINVLRNDGHAALAVAHASGAAFIRVNVLAGVRATDQGVISGVAHELLRARAFLGAAHIRIFADVDVKHSAPLGAPRAIEDEVRDTLHRSGADAVIVSGQGTGRPTDIDAARAVHAAADGRPVIIGSGVCVESIRSLMPFADAFIVGTAFKTDGCVSNPVDPARVRELMQHAHAAPSSKTP